MKNHNYIIKHKAPPLRVGKGMFSGFIQKTSSRYIIDVYDDIIEELRTGIEEYETHQ